MIVNDLENVNVILNTSTRIQKYDFIIPPCNISRASGHANVPVQIVSLICMATAPRERRTLLRHPARLLRPFWHRLRRPSRKRGSDRERWSRVMKRISACASGGRPHVAYIYFLQLTLQDSPRATWPSLTTAVFTMTTTTKRTSSFRDEPHKRKQANALDWLAWIKIN